MMGDEIRLMPSQRGDQQVGWFMLLGRKRRRTLLVLLSIVAALVLVIAGLALIRALDKESGSQSASGSRNGTLEGQATDSASTQFGQSETPEDSGDAVRTGTPPSDSLLIGWFEESRVVASKLNDILEGGAGNSKSSFEGATLSPVVGSPFTFAAVDDGLLLSATNHKQLVRLSSDWKRVEALSMPSEITAGGAFVAIGSILPRAATALLAVESGDGIWVVEVDLGRWRVKRYKLFEGRFAGFPRACLTRDEKIAMVWSRGLDLIDLKSLEREDFVQLGGLPSGVACVGDDVWVGATDGGRGWVISSAGAREGSFSWNGVGSRHLRLVTDPGGDAVFGTDQEAGVVFKCGVVSRSCKTSAQIGMKPTDLVRAKGRIVVVLEDSQAVAVLDESSLRPIRVERFPGRPRALAYMP